MNTTTILQQLIHIHEVAQRCTTACRLSTDQLQCRMIVMNIHSFVCKFYASGLCWTFASYNDKMSDFLTHRWTWVAAGVSAGLGIMLIRRMVAGNVCQSQASLSGKTVVLTGASSGIGKATALELAKRGARVIMACRDVCKAESAVQDIRRQTSCGQLIVRNLDLASLKSVHEFAACMYDEEEFIHVLITNAGVYQYPYTLTEDGLEMQMAVNHFGHFLLVHLLLDKLKASGCRLCL